MADVVTLDNALIERREGKVLLMSLKTRISANGCFQAIVLVVNPFVALSLQAVIIAVSTAAVMHRVWARD